MVDMQKTGNPNNVATGDLQRTGKVFSWVDGPWISTLFFDKEKSPAADTLHAAPLPQHDPNNKATWGQSHQFTLPNQPNQSPEQRAAALKFVQWMTEHSADWAAAGQIPAHNKAREEVLAKDDRVFKELSVWAGELPYVHFMPPHPKLLEIMPRIAANVEGAMLGQWSVEQALQQAEDEVNAILAQ
jgi:multiple sugar transport system substrate-binding protein